MISSTDLIRVSTLFLVLFTLVGAFDGVYFHWYKFKLHLHPQARQEHFIHTLRAFLLGLIVLALFGARVQGGLLLGTLFLMACDFVAEVADVLVEKKARKGIGGISQAETLVHITATSLRCMAIGFYLVAQPQESFSFRYISPSLPLDGYMFVGYAIAIVLLLGGVQQILVTEGWVPKSLKIHQKTIGAAA